MLDENAKSRFSTYRTYNDFKALRDTAQKDKIITVLGSGFLGTELSLALSKDTDASIIQVFPEETLLPKVLPKYLGRFIIEKMKEAGVDVRSEVTITSAILDEEKVNLSPGEIKSDYVVIASSIVPNTQLAVGLEIDSINKGICVGKFLDAGKDVYSAGDVASFVDGELGRRRIEHYDHACDSGRVAGLNMSGERVEYENKVYTILK